MELCRLAKHIASFFHLLKRVDFEAIVTIYHLHHQSKAEPATIRIKRLLELISSYSPNLYYTHEIIPILFDMYQVLHEQYYNTENYLVQTRSQAKSSGIKLPEVHGIGKNLDPNIKPEKQHANPIKGSIEEP